MTHGCNIQEPATRKNGDKRLDNLRNLSPVLLLVNPHCCTILESCQAWLGKNCGPIIGHWEFNWINKSVCFCLIVYRTRKVGCLGPAGRDKKTWGETDETDKFDLVPSSCTTNDRMGLLEMIVCSQHKGLASFHCFCPPKRAGLGQWMSVG